MYLLLLAALAVAEESGTDETGADETGEQESEAKETAPEDTPETKSSPTAPAPIDSVGKTPSQIKSPPQSKQVGYGLSLGTPTGVGCKIYLDNRNRILERSGYAVHMTIGGDQGQIGDWSTSADVVFQTKPLNDPQDGYRLPVYYGLGLTAGLNMFQDNIRGGLRTVAGMVVAIDELPFELAIETGMAFMLIDSPISDSFSHMMLGQISFRHF